MRQLFLFFVVFGAVFAIGAKKPAFVPKRGDLLMTFPRSGTNWTVGILTSLCKRPVRFIKNPNNDESLGVNRLEVDVDDSLPTVYRSHFLEPGIKRLKQSKFRLMFCLRNYKECIVKHHQFNAQEFLDAIRDRHPKVDKYFEDLQFFDSGWKNPKTKHLILYEEIISKPRKCVEELLLFLGESLKPVPEFFEHYDEWNEKMLASYHEQHGKLGPPSNNEPIFHSKDFPKEVLREVDRIIQERYPDLWEKYLYRYGEVD